MIVAKVYPSFHSSCSFEPAGYGFSHVGVALSAARAPSSRAEQIGAANSCPVEPVGDSGVFFGALIADLSR